MRSGGACEVADVKEVAKTISRFYNHDDDYDRSLQLHVRPRTTWLGLTGNI